MSIGAQDLGVRREGDGDENANPTVAAAGRGAARSLPGAEGISVTKLAEACGVTDKHLHAIMSGRAPRLTATMAIRIATALGTTPEYWLDLQRAVELYDARKHIAASGKQPRPMAIDQASAG